MLLISNHLVAMPLAEVKKNPESVRDLLMVVFAFVFGWRDTTVRTI
jgi:hypothetical protein